MALTDKKTRERGGFELEEHKFSIRLDNHDSGLEFGSVDPGGPAKATRVPTLMAAEEY